MSIDQEIDRLRQALEDTDDAIIEAMNALKLVFEIGAVFQSNEIHFVLVRRGLNNAVRELQDVRDIMRIARENMPSGA